MFEWLMDPSAWMALATLTLLEIVLGIDNIIFISILVSKLPPNSDNELVCWVWRAPWSLGFCSCSRWHGSCA